MRLRLDIRRHTNLLEILHADLFRILLILMPYIPDTRFTVLKHRHIGKKIKALEHHANLLTELVAARRIRRHLGAMIKNLSTARNLQSVNAPKKSRFART